METRARARADLVRAAFVATVTDPSIGWDTWVATQNADMRAKANEVRQEILDVTKCAEKVAFVEALTPVRRLYIGTEWTCMRWFHRMKRKKGCT